MRKFIYEKIPLLKEYKAEDIALFNKAKDKLLELGFELHKEIDEYHLIMSFKFKIGYYLNLRLWITMVGTCIDLEVSDWFDSRLKDSSPSYVEWNSKYNKFKSMGLDEYFIKLSEFLVKIKDDLSK